MANMNKLEIIGNLGSKPELRFTPSGKAVCNFSVAVNHQYTTADGEKKEDTEWFNVIAWSRLGEKCNQYLAKGRMVFISGRVSLHKWEKDGKQNSRLELRANNVIFLDKKDNGNSQPEPENENEPDDIPF